MGGSKGFLGQTGQGLKEEKGMSEETTIILRRSVNGVLVLFKENKGKTAGVEMLLEGDSAEVFIDQCLAWDREGPGGAA